MMIAPGEQHMGGLGIVLTGGHLVHCAVDQVLTMGLAALLMTGIMALVNDARVLIMLGIEALNMVDIAGNFFYLFHSWLSFHLSCCHISLLAYKFKLTPRFS